MYIELYKKILDNSTTAIVVVTDDEIKYFNKKLEEIFENKISTDFINKCLNEKTIHIDNKIYNADLIHSDENYKVVEFKEITCEIKLKEKDSFFQTIMNNISDGVILTDCMGHVLEYNKASEEYEGLKRNYVIGRKTTELYNVSESDSEIMKVIRSGEKLLDINGKFQTVNGKDVLLASNYYPVYNDSELIGACAVSIDYTRVQHLLDRTIELQDKLNDNTDLSSVKYNFENIIGESNEIKKAISEGIRAAELDSPTLIVGDTGTGKEMFVQSIHNRSKRSQYPFIPINCAAIPENLLESLLFGTVKGAFTGAENKPGLIEQAQKGTLYLDELNSMPVNIQAKLLRVIQEKKVRRLGGTDVQKVNCRFMASINESPEYCMENNKLRDDLFYRFAVMIIEIPNLVERKNDIEILIKHFINELNTKYKLRVKGISEELSFIFNEYPWPGNVRELQYVIEGAVSMDRNIEEIRYEHLPSYLFKKFSNLKISPTLRRVRNTLNLNAILEATEKEAVIKCLYDNEGNVTKAASCLGISRQNLHYRIRKLKLKS